LFPLFTAGVVDAGGKFATGGTLTYEYLRQFWEKFEMTLMSFPGAWEKMIHDKPDAKNLVKLSL
jgi:hypothetical protein